MRQLLHWTKVDREGHRWDGTRLGSGYCTVWGELGLRHSADVLRKRVVRLQLLANTQASGPRHSWWQRAPAQDGGRGLGAAATAPLPSRAGLATIQVPGGLFLWKRYVSGPINKGQQQSCAGHPPAAWLAAGGGPAGPGEAPFHPHQHPHLELIVRTQQQSLLIVTGTAKAVGA